MSSGKNFGSGYGESPKTARSYVKQVEKEKGILKILVPDAVDGQCIFDLAQKSNVIDAYEDDEKLLYGSEFNNGYSTKGMYKRIEYHKDLKKNINVYEKNYYKCSSKKQYDYVFVYNSLHKSKNSNITMKHKVDKLINSVKEEGYIYMYYHMAIDQSDYNKYPSNSYFRYGEMKELLKKDFKILHLSELTQLRKYQGHPYNEKDHNHLVGYVLAKKKVIGDIYLNHKFKYIIRTSNK